MSTQTIKDLSFGEKAVGLNFNPSANDEVGQIKKKFADIIDNLDNLRGGATSYEIKRMYSIAITEVQTAQMWAVKAITWQH
jgi:hypothetical protein